MSHIVAPPPCDLSPSGRDVVTIVAQVVQDVLGASAVSLVEPLRDRGLNSLGMSNILIGLEEAFDFSFADADITPELFQSVDALSRHVRTRIAGAGSQ